MIVFSIREAKKIVFGTPVVSFFSIVSITVGILLITFSFFINQKKQELNQFLSESMFVTAYVKPDANNHQLEEIRKRLHEISGVSKIEFTSVEDAKKKFIAETGEDFSVFLDVNPLPASFQVWFKAEEKKFNSEEINTNIPKIKKIAGIEEVQFDASFQSKLLKWMKKVENYIYVLTAVILFLSCYVVFVTQKLGLQNRMSEIETMKLVGSKKMQIKIPFYIASIIFSLIAFTLSIIFLLSLKYFFSQLNINFGYLSIKIFFVINFFSAMILSFAGTFISLRKIKF